MKTSPSSSQISFMKSCTSSARTSKWMRGLTTRQFRRWSQKELGRSSMSCEIPWWKPTIDSRSPLSLIWWNKELKLKFKTKRQCLHLKIWLWKSEGYITLPSFVFLTKQLLTPIKLKKWHKIRLSASCRTTSHLNGCSRLEQTKARYQARRLSTQIKRIARMICQLDI